MRSSSLTTSLLALLSGVVSAASAFSGDPLQIKHIKVHSVDRGNDTISFQLHDPDPLTNQTATCSAVWPHSSNAYPTGSYARCQNTTLGWNMVSFTSYNSFVLGLQSSFKDPSVGDPPYDHVVNFAQVNVTEPSITCSDNPNGRRHRCRQATHTTIYAPITASIAKKT